MSFTEKLKDKVRKKSHYQCCVCKELFIDIHHIIPESENGPDDIDNAAPLCAKCHRQFGNNPDHRKTIRGMRDLWYKICKTRYKDNYSQPIFEKLDSLGQEIIAIKDDKVKESAILEDIKKEICKLRDKEQENIKSSSSVEEIQSESITATKLGSGVHANVHCNKCNTTIGLLVGTDNCPNCGNPIN